MARGIKATAQSSPASKAARSTSKPSAGPAERAPMVTKDQLRAQVEKLQQTNATLRAKSPGPNRATKVAAARIAELEDEVATLRKQTASRAASEKRGAKISTHRSRDVDPGDAVPPGVAVAEAQPMDEKAKTALENLEQHFGKSG